MQKQARFDLKPLMLLYNVVQVVLCTWMTIGLSEGLSFPNIMGLWQEYTPSLEFFLFVHYLSKYLDFFDTFFIVTRKSDEQFSFLHLYHHATIGPIWGLLLWLGHANGTIFFGAWLNSIVHALMYTHYLLASLKINNPFKRHITQLQIMQFVLCVLHAMLCIALEAPDISRLAYIQFFYQISLIVLFRRFYTKRYDATKRA
jgi:hypothetical protein